MKIDFTNPDIYVDRVEEVAAALYDPDIRFVFLKWWSGAGKSYLVAQLMIQNLLDGVRIGFFRKVNNTLRASCLQLMKDVKRDMGLPSSIIDIKESKEIRAGEWLGMMFWLDDEEKIKSIANFDWFWLEETTEFTYDDFQQLNLRLRGWDNHKIICSFNPVSAKSRLKREVEDHPERRPNAVRISKTAWDNRFVGDEYLAALDALRLTNPSKHKIYALNLWGEWSKGSVFPDYDVFEHDIEPDAIGLDFWFNDPNALTYLKVEDKSDKKDLYVQEKIHSTWQTSQDLIAEMDRIGVPKNVLILADSARPEMIADIRKAGYTIQGVKKYKNSKNDQIDHVKSYNIHVNWPNIIREIAEYCWLLDKKSGEPMDTPQDGYDHLLDSMLYGSTKFKRSEAFALFI